MAKTYHFFEVDLIDRLISGLLAAEHVFQHVLGLLIYLLRSFNLRQSVVQIRIFFHYFSCKALLLDVIFLFLSEFIHEVLLFIFKIGFQFLQ